MPTGGCCRAEDALQHLLNFLWPNIFETSPHVMGTVFEAIEAMRVALGPGVMMAYVRSGLFHPARRVREVYWRLYNNLVVYSGHALPAFLPRLPEEEAEEEQEGVRASVALPSPQHRYQRTMLELIC